MHASPCDRDCNLRDQEEKEQRVTLMPPRRSTTVRRYLLSSSLQIAATAALLLASRQALATQPLETFLEAARTSSFEVREQLATVEQREWERESVFGRLLPGVSARGVYTRNQYAAVITAPGTATGAR